ncbi:unnamed protein product [Vitrella brassicaformis CCMP3155]|uniref:Uncharacterized protein n=1 Tax=Vitrella brassicaformis (strain CCMP3155) TaxID=1169540 RepID=A0A0G4GC40_VITBC|nr:unnamed protein product [Vitrella brassicaformis CCMP3155]|eukprot:CEM26535.1 unnamed protein product [Vitrella brassicaformis CCMP3155]
MSTEELEQGAGEPRAITAQTVANNVVSGSIVLDLFMGAATPHRAIIAARGELLQEVYLRVVPVESGPMFVKKGALMSTKELE